ncbi:MAG TPA: DNA polymerase III subunit epsilon [Falsiroseomonas sp.]|jgi:hypothetical protein|nr:DNA polymerase III subunit epsilon [Falsiroseomonas sp.]
MITNTAYVVTDVEFDGPVPGRHSMLSFASVAVTCDGRVVGEFEAVLDRLDGASPDPETMAFWRTQPEAYAAATLNPAPASMVMPRFVAWVRSLPGEVVFTAHPLALDGPWIDFYLQRFTAERLIEGPWRAARLFRSAPLCLMSFAAGRLGWPIWSCDVDRYPPAWLGAHPHTHRAIDDARGYAHLLGVLMGMRQPT